MNLEIMNKSQLIKKGIVDMKKVLLSLFLILLFSGLILSGCGKKGPPEIIGKSVEKLKPVENLTHQINGNSALLKWEANYKQSIDGFEIYMAKQNIQECKECPVVFVKIDYLSSDHSQYQKKQLKKGYRYFFKIITLGVNDIKSIDSAIIKFEFKL